MKVAVLSTALVLAATGAMAQSRPSTRAMTCGQTQALVASRGAVVLNTSPTTYERFVTSQGFCQFNEMIQPMWAPTRDTPQCPIGYRCKENDWEMWD